MIEAARNFVWHNARVLEQRRFLHLFDGGPAEPVVAAVLAYRNDDGSIRLDYRPVEGDKYIPMERKY